MSILKPIGICGIILALNGCDNDTLEDMLNEETVIYGRPLSVAHNYGYATAGIVTVVEVNHRRQIAYTNSNITLLITKAEALIQSEIADADSEYIELRGFYTKGNFKFKKLKVDGNSLEF